MARQRIPGIAPRRASELASVGSLAASAQRQTAGAWGTMDGIDGQQPAWLAGLRWSSWCPSIRSDAACTDHSEDLKELGESRQIVGVDPVEFYLFVICAQPVNTEELDAEALAHVDAGSSAPLAAVLLTGETTHGPVDQTPNEDEDVRNPTLESVAEVVSDTAVLPGVGIAALLEARALCTSSTVIHVPVALLPHLLASEQITREGDLYRAATGAIVVADVGYSAEAVPADVEATPLGPGEAWAWASGPIEFALDSPIILAAHDTGALRRNRYEAMVKRQGIVRFEPCCVFATKVTIPDECCGEEVSA